MNASFIYEDVNAFALDEDVVTSWLINVCNHERKTLGDLSIVFCSDEYLLEVNRKYLNHDYFTDIITFDYSEQETISGDLLISIDRVKENALLVNVGFREELFRVMVHGVLHLVGYDDTSDRLKAEMRVKENYYLSFT